MDINLETHAQWANIPAQQLRDHISYCETVAQKAKTQHQQLLWDMEVMVSLLHSFYCRSKGYTPSSIQELETYWKTGNIATRNLHTLLPQTSQTIAGTKCGLCQSPIQAHESHYELPCGDRFHAIHGCCDPTHDIKDTLRNNNQCPCCWTRILLPDAT